MKNKPKGTFYAGRKCHQNRTLDKLSNRGVGITVVRRELGLYPTLFNNIVDRLLKNALTSYQGAQVGRFCLISGPAKRNNSGRETALGRRKQCPRLIHRHRRADRVARAQK